MASELEKRTFQRLQIPIEVATEIVTGEETPRGLSLLHCQSRNISKTGICLETTALEIEGINLLSGAPYSRENRLYLNIDLNPDEPPFTAIGEVRWYDVVRDASEFRYQMGIEFIEIKGNGKDQLNRFLKSHKTGDGFFQKFFR
jgi:hypothetical protein